MSEKGSIKIKYAKEEAWNTYQCPICTSRNWFQIPDTLLLKLSVVKKIVEINVSDDVKIRPVTSPDVCGSLLGKLVCCNVCGYSIFRAGQPINPKIKKEEEV